VVWQVANGEIPAGYEIDHIDGDKANNNISNLRLVTRKENILLARERLGNWAKSKLKPHHKLLTLLMPSNANWAFWAERWGVTKQHLLNIRHRSM
jgi:hypothetical protein